MPAMAGTAREQALALLAAANNHGDLSVKLSSLKQAKDILVSAEPSVAAELLPYLVELQTSPQSLVRISLIKAMEEIGSKAMEYCYIRLVPVLLAFLQDSDTTVARQSIISGTNLFCHVLEGLALEFHHRGKIERWLEELWMWMARFKDAVFDIVLKPGSVGTRLLGIKFLETFVLLFTSDSSSSEKPPIEGLRGGKWVFNVSWLAGGHPVLDPAALMSESNRCLGILLDLLQSSSSLSSTLTITVVNCLAAISRKRPIHYNTVLSALFDFGLTFEMAKSGHTPSIQYSLRTAFLGFLRCPHSVIAESRDKLLRALRAMNAGDAADQVIRQVDKMMRNNERVSRDIRLTKDDQSYSQLPILGDRSRKRSMLQDSEQQMNGHEVPHKRSYYGPSNHLAAQGQLNDLGQDCVSDNGLPSNVPLPDSESTEVAVEQVIDVIAAFLTEGQRGVDSLELLLSEMEPDVLADIVITNMKHLPKSIQPSTRPGNLPVVRQIDASSSPAQVASSTGPSLSVQSSVLTAQVASSSETAVSTSGLDLPVFANSDSKRDPRRDPRRLDPRRAALPVGAPSAPIVEVESCAGHSEGSASISLSKLEMHGMASIEKIPVPCVTKSEDEIVRSPLVSVSDTRILEEDILEQAKEVVSTPEFSSSDHVPSTVCTMDEGLNASNPSEIAETDRSNVLSFMEYDQLSPTVSNTSASEEAWDELPPLPSYVELTGEQKMNVKNLAIERIIDSGKILQWTDCSQTRMALLARLVAQMDANEDIVVMLQKNIILDYRQQKGHELVLQVLYHLHAVTILDSVEHSSFAAVVYEKFLLAVVRSLLINLPASDKSFSRLLGEVPLLPDSALKLLDDLCCADIYDPHGKEIRDVDCVIQGLGVVWSLILKRPPYRQACLNIALKCAVHSQDEIRSQAIRLVANKLYVLSYASDNIEQFATNMLLSAVDQQVSETEILQAGSTEQRTEWEEASISGSQMSELTTSESDSIKGAQMVFGRFSSTISRHAQCLISLYFSLCTKKPTLLQLVFQIYGRAPKTVKQAFCRHIPILVRALGSSCSELLCIISDPPQGSEDLLSEVLKVLTEGTMPSSDLIAIVKHLYETKLKDASILIPMLSSLSKNEVLPIFPRLVDLPLEKFQLALAHILQGSAHTGPALTPSEVLVAIHNINPEKDGVPLKKIMDACSTCFEQRTVFTQQVLAKALNHMVDQIPLPLLFMRTVIQAIDAFPTLVDFVMEILSKLVSKQVWKMPKLWFGFLKCVAQTRPHSFNVLLQLPPPQLESALTKHSSLRGPLAAYASHPNRRSSLPRSILMALGVSNESQLQQSQLASSLRPPDASSSVHGAAST